MQAGRPDELELNIIGLSGHLVGNCGDGGGGGSPNQFASGAEHGFSGGSLVVAKIYIHLWGNGGRSRPFALNGHHQASKREALPASCNGNLWLSGDELASVCLCPFAASGSDQK